MAEAFYYAKVVYNANGGSGAPAAQSRSTATAGGAINFTVSSGTSSRTYYNFKGWALTSGSSTGMSGGTVISLNASTTPLASNARVYNLYAAWEHQTAYVYYNSNGGTGAPSTQSHWAGYSVTLSSTVPTRSGYNFLGWSTSQSATAATYQPGEDAALHTTTTLYAVWKVAASTLTVSGGLLGSALTININRYDASYHDGISYQFGETVGTVIGSTTETSVTWTPPLSLASEIPNSTSGTLTLVCWTYDSGGNFLGTSTTHVTLSVPDYVVPTLSVSQTIVNTNATVSGWGILLQNYSQMKLTATAAAGTGATVASYTFSGDGMSYSGSSNEQTSSVLTSSGSKTWTIKVTDSRGRTATVTSSATVVEYAAPSVSSLTAFRADSGGNRDDAAGTYIKATGVFEYSSCDSHNSLSVDKIEYQAEDAGSWTVGQNNAASGTAYTFGGGNITETKTFHVRLSLTDALGNSAVYTVDIAPIVGYGFGLKNDRVHFGGPCKEPGFVCDFDTKFLANVDVVPRRCSATLSSAHWYRVLHYEGISNDQAHGVVGLIIDFDITRDFSHANNEAHSIKLMATYESMAWANEVSKSNYFLIDKIRWTYNGTDAYVDIHYTGTGGNNVAVCFDVKAVPDACKRITAESMQSVVDAPVGETILSTYTFHANYNPTMVDIWSAVTLNYSELRKDVRVQGGMVNMLLETYFASYLADYEYTIGTVSAPYRPTYPVFFTGVATDGSSNPRGLILFTIYQNGDLTVRINNTDGNYLILNATYPIDT